MSAILYLSQLDPNGTYTYADYLTWRFEQAVELIKGKIFPMSAPSMVHQKLSMKLSLMLGNYTDGKCNTFAAPFDVRLLDKHKSAKANKEILTTVQPDLCIVCDNNKLDKRGCLGAPDLVIEILSEGNSKKEMKIKFDLYEENDIPEYWIVSPEHQYVQQFHVDAFGKYQLCGIFTTGEVLTSIEFPELQVPISKLFPEEEEYLDDEV